MEESDRKGLFLAACEQFGGADILVNNAASWTTSMAGKNAGRRFSQSSGDESDSAVSAFSKADLPSHGVRKKGKYFKCGFQSGHHGIEKKSFSLCIIESRLDRAYEISCQGNCRIPELL